MTHRITGLGPRPTDTGAARRPDAARTQDAAKSGAASGGASAPSADKVELTPSAVLLQRLEEHIRNLPDVDTERVQSIKDAIAAGEYRVDADRVAAKMTELERELR